MKSAVLMGILNVTPDSFYDGGQFFSKEKAIEHAFKLIEEGADLLDIGGESTRPGSDGISVEEEWGRVVPVIEHLASRVSVPISIDTTKAAVARAAIDAGATIVNDISGFSMDREMVDLLKHSTVRYVLTHLQGTPKEMQLHPSYKNVVLEIDEFFSQKIALLTERGIESHRLILDPGIGFGKRASHNIEILRSLKTFSKWGCPILIGTSRKSFFGDIQKTCHPRNGGDLLSKDSGPADHLSGSLASAVWAYLNGVTFFRVHDVLETKKALLFCQRMMT